jgi:DNA-binding beta-propeller fold protein YncE
MKEKVAVIDSREHSVVHSIEVPNVPYLIYPTIDGKKFVVVSAGMGKVPGDPRDAFSIPSVSILDITTRTILKSSPLNTPGLDLMSELPNSLIVTNNDWAFILTSKYLIRIDARDPSYSNRVEEFTYKQIYHNNVYNELFALDSKETGSKIYKLNPITGKKLEFITLSKNITKLHLY